MWRCWVGRFKLLPFRAKFRALRARRDAPTGAPSDTAGRVPRGDSTVDTVVTHGLPAPCIVPAVVCTEVLIDGWREGGEAAVPLSPLDFKLRLRWRMMTMAVRRTTTVMVPTTVPAVIDARLQHKHTDTCTHDRDGSDNRSSGD